MKKFELDTRINENGWPVTKIPSMADYNIAKKQINIGVDLAEGEDETSIIVVDRETFCILYWATLPAKEKHKIKIGDNHDNSYLQKLST